jgi:IS5 family transposase
MAISYIHQITFGMWALQELLDPSHNLVKLAEVIDWEEVHLRLAPYYSITGRRGLPIRLMVGLHLLKHKENMSDEKCAERIRADLYWMYFCGVDSEDLKGKYRILNSATMTKFRRRIGTEGFAEVENIIREYLLEKKFIDTRVMNTDSTCQPKNVIYPTDSALLDRGRRLVLQGMKKLVGLGVKPVEGLRTFSRKSKKIIINLAKLGKDRQERIKEGTLELARQARHVVGKCRAQLGLAKRQIKKSSMEGGKKIGKEIEKLKAQLDILKRVILQSRERYKGNHISGKIYSIHEPEVIVIRKGKAHRPNEYGSKLNISTDTHGFIVNHETYQENHHDSKLLDPAIKNWEKVTGKTPNQLNTDRGYKQKRNARGRFKKINKICIPWCGKKKNPEAKKEWFKRGQRQRSQIEGTIAHLKQNHRLGRCRYAGARGNHINACLAATAWNLTKLCTRM